MLLQILVVMMAVVVVVLTVLLLLLLKKESVPTLGFEPMTTALPAYKWRAIHSASSLPPSKGRGREATSHPVSVTLF